MIQAVLDVNVIVSALLAPLGIPRQLLSTWEEGRFAVITSEGIIAEVEEKLQDPALGGAYGITLEDRRWVRALLSTQAEVVAVPPAAVLPITNDPEDDYVLASAKQGQAQYLVTGDKKLQKMGIYAGVTILSPRAFWNLLTTQTK